MMDFLFALGMLIFSYIIQAAITPKPEKPKPAALGEFDIPQTEERTPQAVIFGDVWVSDWAVLWYGNLRSNAIKSSGGKK